MTRTPYAGGSYCEALPSGEYAVLYAGRYVETHFGAVYLPPEGSPLYLRITNVPSFQMCGQASQAFGTLHWQNGSWHLDPRIAHGTSGAIFEADGTLRIMQPAPGQSSQGYRFVDEGGAVWLGDATYGPLNGLNEWSFYRDLYIGQGNQGGGVMVWDGAALRVLDTGDCRFIRVRGQDEKVAISYWKQDEGAVIAQMTLSELRSLPIYAPSTPPPVEPPPQPKPEPPKTEPPVEVPYLYEEWKAARAALGKERLTADEEAALVNNFAYKHGFLVYKKSGGWHGTQPRTGIGISTDLMGYPVPGSVLWADVLGSTDDDGKPGPAIAQWPASHDWQFSKPEDVGNYIAPVAPEGEPQQPPAPKPEPEPKPEPPKPPSMDLSVVLARLDVTDARHAQDISELKAAVLKLAASIEAIKMPPPAAVTFPDYQGSIPYLGSVRLKPVK